MMFSALIMLMISMAVNAQKVDSRLKELIPQPQSQIMSKGSKPSQSVNADYMVVGKVGDAITSVAAQAYLKQDAECPTALLEQMGITVHFIVDNVAVLTVPVDKIAELENVEEIVYVKADMKQQYDNDEARKSTQANKVVNAAQATSAGLPQAYTGKGVLVGIIDGGIDFNHAAFRNPTTGVTRVKKVLIYDSETPNPKEYSTPEAIAALTTEYNRESHGTHTSSTAVGSDIGNGMQGVAPEADIIFAALGENNGENNQADAIKRIAAYAKEVNMPCVISMSIGSIVGLHDGSVIVCKTVKELTESGNKQGLAVCISSGNAASNFPSVVQTLGAPDGEGWQMKAVLGYEFTSTEPLPFYSRPYFYEAYATDGKDFTAELRLVNIETGQVISDLSSVLVARNPITGELTEVASFKLNKNTVASNAPDGTSVTYSSSLSHSKIYLKSGYEKYRLAVFVKGTVGQEIRMVIGKMSEYSEPLFYTPQALLDKGFAFGSSELSGNVNNCDDSVISVGAYVTRTEWDYYNRGSNPLGKLAKSLLTGKEIEKGSICDFSSYCTKDDKGKARPTLIGPGQNILSAYNLHDIEYFIEGEIDDTDYATLEKKPMYSLAPASVHKKMNGRNNFYGYLSGTSMSTPHVAGIVALWMQANPKLTVNGIKDVMKETCVKDVYCTNAEKIASGSVEQAGMGKIDAVAGLKKILATTAIDIVSADEQRQATPATMFDVDAPVYNSLGQQVSKDTPGIVIYKGRAYFNR